MVKRFRPGLHRSPSLTYKIFFLYCYKFRKPGLKQKPESGAQAFDLVSLLKRIAGRLLT